MTEQQIKDGFEQLAGALAPPGDAQDRVDRRVRVRRRRRRAGVVAGAVAGVAAVGGVVFAGLGGDEGGGAPVAVDPPPGLTMERPDGSTVTFDDVRVSCDPPMAQGDTRPLAEPSPGTIWAYSPISFTGSVEDDEVQLEQPFVMIQGTVAKLQGDRLLELPIDGPGGSDTYPLVVFVADTEGGTPGDPGNEVASSSGGTGTVRVLEASCDPVPVLRLEIEGVLDSEEGKQSLDLTGALR